MQLGFFILSAALLLGLLHPSPPKTKSKNYLGYVFLRSQGGTGQILVLYSCLILGPIYSEV